MTIKEYSANPDSRSELGQKTALVMAFTIISRIGGFARDAILAQVFGAGQVFDAFAVAFRIPNFMRRLFGEGAFAQSLVPTLAEYHNHRSVYETQLFINQLMSFLTFISLGIVIVTEIMAPVMVLLLAPGFIHDTARYHLAIQLFRITQPYLISMALVALAGAILNSYHRFALTAFTPIVLNVTLIVIAYYLSPEMELLKRITLLAWGIFISGIIQMAIQIPAIIKLKLRPRLVWSGFEPRVKIIFKQIFPAIFGVSIAQISLLLDNLFASYLSPGSISWLYYADRLIYLPLGIIGVALAVVVLPHLSHFHQKKAKKDFAAVLDWSLRCTLVIAIPAAIGLGLLAKPILAALMHHGAFTSHDVIMTGKSLTAFALGLPAWMLIKILASAFYSQQNIKTPARIVGLALLANIIFNIFLVQALGHVGLALATSLASWLNAILLWIFLLKQGHKLHEGWLRLGFGIFAGSLAMASFLIWRMESLSNWLEWDMITGLEHLIILIGTGGMIYFLVLAIAGLRLYHFAPPKLE